MPTVFHARNINHETISWATCSSALTLFLIILFFITRNFIFCELTDTYMRQRNLWKKKEIRLSEVTSAGKFGFGIDAVIVRFGHQTEDYGNVVLQPLDSEGFLATLQKFAPQAKVDI
jgi:hypothetical protein